MGAARVRKKLTKKSELQVTFIKTGESRHVFPSEVGRMAPPNTSLIFEDATQLAVNPCASTATVLAGESQGPTFAIVLSKERRTAAEERHRKECDRREETHAVWSTFALILRKPPCHPTAPLAIGLTRDDKNKLRLIARCDKCGQVHSEFHIAPADPEEERNRRWGIADADDLGWLYQLIDRKRKWNDGDNIVPVSKIAIDWLDQQPETRIPLVIEMLMVHAMSHRTGIVGGIGSEQHNIAMAALGREKASATQQQLVIAVKTCIELFQRGKKQWPESKFMLLPEPAATPEEIIAFHEERSPQVSAAVN